MSRLFAYIASDPDRVKCALEASRGLLTEGAPSDAGPARVHDGWGIGFYQGGEVLLQRRPKPASGPIDLYAIVKDLRTDVIIGHVRGASEALLIKPTTENTHPFRFRSWLFAHNGAIPDFETHRDTLMAKVPDFLARNIRGQTDSEIFFHLLLGCLHEASVLDEAQVAPGQVADAIRKTVALVDEVCGGKVAECSFAVTNGRILLLFHRGAPMWIRHSRGITDCAVCREVGPADKRLKRIDHEHLRSVTALYDPEQPMPKGQQWEELANDTVVSVAHDLTVATSPLSGLI